MDIFTRDSNVLEQAMEKLNLKNLGMSGMFSGWSLFYDGAAGVSIYFKRSYAGERDMDFISAAD